MWSWVELSNNTGFNLISPFFDRYTKKLLAFTLAETLIVMGIIGVVATLTIPNLNSSTKHKESVTRLKKIYAQLNEAHTRAIAVYGSFENRFPAEVDYRPGGWQCYSCAAVYTDRITEFLKVQKYFRDQSSPRGCAANSKIKKVDLTE